MPLKEQPLDQWVNENAPRYLLYLEELYASTYNPLFLWEAARIANEKDPLTPPRSCLLYFGSYAHRVFDAVRRRQGLDMALELGDKHGKHLNQFEDLKDPRSPRTALWYSHKLLALAAEGMSRTMLK